MWKALAALFALALIASVARAAPAPFPKSPPADVAPATADRVKQQLLKDHNLYADAIRPGGLPDTWIVKGNSPVLDEGRLMYAQRVYTVRVTGTDRRGGLRLSLTEMTPVRKVITR